MFNWKRLKLNISSKISLLSHRYQQIPVNIFSRHLRPLSSPGWESGKFSPRQLLSGPVRFQSKNVKLQPGRPRNILECFWRSLGGFCAVLLEAISRETRSSSLNCAASYWEEGWKQLPAPAAERGPSLCTSIRITPPPLCARVWWRVCERATPSGDMPPCPAELLENHHTGTLLKALKFEWRPPFFFFFFL